jgi:hypothetical protein
VLRVDGFGRAAAAQAGRGVDRLRIIRLVEHAAQVNRFLSKRGR